MACHLWAYSRAALAAPDAALALAPQRIHIAGAMDHDVAVTGPVIDARLKAIHAQGVAVGALVAFAGTKQPEAGLEAAFAVGKSGGKIFTGVLPMSDQLTQDQLFRGQVEDP